MMASTEHWKCAFKFNEHDETDDQVPFARSGHAVCTVGDRLYMHGGNSHSSSESDLWYFDTLRNRWNHVALSSPLKPQERIAHTLCYFRNRAGLEGIIMFGGWNSYRVLNEVWVFDFAISSWTQITWCSGDIPAPRSNHACCMRDDDCMILFGGFGRHDVYNDLYELDTNTWRWQRISPPTSAESNTTTITTTAATRTSTLNSPANNMLLTVAENQMTTSIEQLRVDEFQNIGSMLLSRLQQMQHQQRVVLVSLSGDVSVVDPTNNIITRNVWPPPIRSHCCCVVDIDDNGYLLLSNSNKTATNSTTNECNAAAANSSSRQQSKRRCMVVFGGGTAEDCYPVTVLWIYDFASGIWTNLTAVHSTRWTQQPSPRFFSTIGAIDRRLYVYGGRQEANRKSDLWSFDLTTGLWTLLPLAGGPLPISGHHSGVINNTLVMYGGDDGSSSIGDVFVLLPESRNLRERAYELLLTKNADASDSEKRHTAKQTCHSIGYLDVEVLFKCTDTTPSYQRHR